MEKLKHMTKQELAAEYYNKFGLPADHHPTDTIISALWFGKRIKYLTEEEINAINEY